MNLVANILTDSDCYKTKRNIVPKGIMVHSTATPGVKHERWFEVWSRPGCTVCPHAVVDDTGVYQVLPWDHRSWHAGASGNDTHISFEICEPAGIKYNAGGWAITEYDAEKNREYFQAIWDNAVELCACLCKRYGLTERDIVCHSEGYRLKIASNHADVEHWFPKRGKTMDDFREAVRQELNKESEAEPKEEKAAPSAEKVLYRVQVGAFENKENAAALVRQLSLAGFAGVVKEEEKNRISGSQEELFKAEEEIRTLLQEKVNIQNEIKAACDLLKTLIA